jgi:hypothetical protein
MWTEIAIILALILVNGLFAGVAVVAVRLVGVQREKPRGAT